jgi:hypothetical protein
MSQDRYGLPISSVSAVAGQAYVEGVDPGFALAHIGRARSLQLLGRGALAQEAAEQARAAAATLDRRERRHVDALAVAGQGGRALALIREHVAEFPRDAMALAAAGDGSWAQRDLFEHTLLAASLRAGRAAEARALLARRMDRQPSVAVAGAA